MAASAEGEQPAKTSASRGTPFVGREGRARPPRAALSDAHGGSGRMIMLTA